MFSPRFTSVVFFLLATISTAHANPPAEESCPYLIAASAGALAVGRQAGMAVTADSLRHSIRVLAGEEPIPGSDSTIRDRYTLENRTRVRRYLVSRLKEFGFTDEDIELEAEQSSSYSYGGYGGYGGYSSYSSYDSEPKKETKKKKKKKGKSKAKAAEVVDTEVPVVEEGEASAGIDEEDYRAEIVNICATVVGTKYPNEVIEVSAHYDSVFEGAPGADDNGSGVATVLEVARAIRQLKPERTIRVVFADLEERGMQGTQMHVRRLKEREDEVFLGAMVVDTIAYFPKYVSHKPGFVVEVGTPYQHQTRAHYDRTAKFASSVLDQMKAYDRHAEGIPMVEDALPGTADHGPYWRGGYPAVLVAAIYEDPYINPGYHKTSDTSQNFDWQFFHSIAQQVVEAAVRLGDAPAKVKAAASDVVPSSKFLSSNRNHVEVEVARLAEESRIAEEKRRKERELFLERQAQEQKLADERRERERQERINQLERERLVVANRLDWSFENLNLKVAEYLGMDVAKEAAAPKGFWSSLTSIFTGDEEPRATSVDLPDSKQFPLLLLSPPREGKEGPVQYKVLMNLKGLEKAKQSQTIQRFLKNTVEIIYTGGEYGTSSSLVRIGELVFSVKNNRLEVRKYDADELHGKTSVVMFATPKKVEWLLIRLCRYLSFLRDRGSFHSDASPAFSAGYMNIKTPLKFKSYHPAFSVELSLQISEGEKRRLWFVEKQAGFRLRAHLDGSLDAMERGAEVYTTVSRPALRDFGASVLRDVLGVDIPTGEWDYDLFQAIKEKRLLLPLFYGIVQYASK